MKRAISMTRINKVSTIKNNMIIYSLSIILLMTILSVYLLSIMDRYKGQIDTMFEKHIYLSSIEEVMNRLDENLLGFLSSKNSTRLNEYIINAEELENIVQGASNKTFNIEDLMLKDISNLVDQYIFEANEAISYKRQRNVAKYYSHYETSKKIKSYIFDYIEQLNSRQLTRNSKAYIELVSQMRLLQWITFIIVIDLIILSLLIVYLITSRMVKPFSHLSHAAEEIAKGNLNTADIVLTTEDEFKVLADAFNKMKNSISKYVEELTFKAETEAALKDEQMKNLMMAHLLDNAKLYALQSQINPHFLFNTINAGVQLSILERANNTTQFLETMSRLFRYNIRKMDSSCTLREEIENIKDFYELLKVRFRSRIQFQFMIDPETLDMIVPPLILQPMAENAYIHGLSGLEEGGLITVQTYKTSEATFIIVEDTGKGMTTETIDQILNRDREDYEKISVGIGVRNVRDRLELFFHRKDVFSIESVTGEGTKIIIEIKDKKNEGEFLGYLQTNGVKTHV